MSLIHWWPLNGNTKDYGLHNSSITGSASFSSAGKIGQCLSSGTLVLPAADAQTTFNKNGTSVAFWVYLCEETYHVLFSTDNMTPPNNRRFTIFQYPDASSLHISWQNYDDSDAFVSDIAYNSVTPNAWNHICETWDGRYARIYVNGSLVKTHDAGQGACYTDDWAIDTVIARATNGVKYNDVRIYNHALSAKEVKEISKGLVLHYNFEDAYAEGTTNLITQTIPNGGWYWSGSATVTSSTVDVDNPSLPFRKCMKTIYEISESVGGTYDTLQGHVPVSGNTLYAYSVYVKTNLPFHRNILYRYEYDSNNSYITEGGIASESNREDLGSGWYRYYGTFTTQSNTQNITFQTFNYPSETGEFYRYVGGAQVERKDHTTPYVNGTRQSGIIYDSSGYGNNGTQVNLGDNLQIVQGSCSGNYCARFNSSCAVDAGTSPMVGPYITVNLFAYRDSWTDSERYAIASCTEGGGWNFNNNDVANSMAFLAYRDGYGYAAPNFLLSEMTPGWHMLTGVVGPDGTKIYLDGVLKDTNSNTGTLTYPNSHIFVGTEANGPYALNSYKFPGKIADFKIYATALSAEDILLEYNRKASIDKKGNLFAPYIKEHEGMKNIGELANYNIEAQHAFDGRFGVMPEDYYNANFPNGQPGLGTYQQGNLTVTMTSQGIRIYSEPNRDGRAQEGSEWNTWGGFCWSPMKQYRCLIKGHHYRLSWHVSGQSSRPMNSVYWSNQIGWGQYPDAEPTVHKTVLHLADFQGEMDCFYDFTIEDDIFKTTGSDVHSGFEPNTSYLAYSAFKIGYEYGFTGTLGTDIYITNLKLYDLTSGKVYSVGHNGMIKTTEVVAGRRSSARLHSDGVIDVTDIIEY